MDILEIVQTTKDNPNITILIKKGKIYMSSERMTAEEMTITGIPSKR